MNIHNLIDIGDYFDTASAVGVTIIRHVIAKLPSWIMIYEQAVTSNPMDQHSFLSGEETACM